MTLHKTLKSGTNLATSLAFSALFSFSAMANPEGGTVTSGSANISAQGNILTIKQNTPQTFIDWRGFNIAPNETTQFQQPSNQATAINRVTSNNPSNIAGTLTANGNVILINPNGVLFNKGSKVDVNGLVTTTASSDHLNIKDGKLVLDKAGNKDAKIINNGTITAKEAGLVGLVAPTVENNGIITAKLGTVHLASGDGVTVDFSGKNLINITLSDSVSKQIVKNTGTVKTDGGLIAITATTGKNIVDSLLHIGGDLTATSLTEQGGKIILGGNESTTTTLTNATLDASGVKAGDITITGKHIATEGNTLIAANGNLGGGNIKIGGDYQGAGNLLHADTTTISENTHISADAISQGNGGKVIVWSDKKTAFNGVASAKGGKENGNGGLVETSSHGLLTLNGMVNTSAPHGASGEWLLDPADVVIDTLDANMLGSSNFTPDGSVGTSHISTSTIVTALDNGTHVTVTTGGDGHAGNGDITVANTITSSGNGDLTLSASNNIYVNAAIDLAGGDLVLRADNDGNQLGAIDVQSDINTYGGNITIGGGTGAITAGSGYAYGNISHQKGVYFHNMQMTASGGNIIINGQGASGGGFINGSDGITLDSAAISNSGTGTITLNGRAGVSSENDYGININNSTISSTNGDISLSGQIIGGSTDSAFLNLWNAAIDTTNASVNMTDTGTSASGLTSGISDPLWGSHISAGNNITLITDYETGVNTLWNAGNTITVKPLSAGVDVYVGASGSAWPYILIRNGNLNNLWTATSYVFGSDTTGDVTFNSNHNFGDTYLSIYSGNDINLTENIKKSSGSSNSVYYLQADGNITNTSGKGINTTSGTSNLSMRSNFDGVGGGAINLTNAPLLTNGGSIYMNGSSSGITYSGTLGGSANLVGGTGAITLGAVNGDTSGTRNLTATGGSISHTGNLGTSTALNRITLTSNLSDITLPTITTTGNISVNARGNTITTTGAINSGTGNQSYISDNIVIGGNLIGTGVLTLHPYNINRLIRLNNYISDGNSYHLDSTELGYIQNGWSGITLGTSSGGAYMVIGDTTWYDPVTFRSYVKSISGNISGLDNASLTFAGTYGAEWHADGATVSTAGNAINFSNGLALYEPNLTIESNGGDITITGLGGQTTAIGHNSITSGNGNISIGNIWTGIVTGGDYVFNTGTGNLNFTSTVDTVADISASANTITTTGAWGNSTTLGHVVLYATNAITLPSISASTIGVTTTGAGADITIGAGKTLTASGSGTPIMLISADDFFNTTGGISTPSGRWLIYSNNPDDNTIGGLSEGFHRYNCTYGVTCPALGTGNGLLYSYTPTLTATPSIQNITYGDNATTVGYGYGLTGYRAEDIGHDTVTGTLTGTTAYTAGNDIGNYALDYDSDTLASALGYSISYANNATALHVSARTLTTSLTGTVSKAYDGNTTATLTTANYNNLSNIYNTDDVSLVAPLAGTYDTATIGAGKTINVAGLALAGTKASNYVLSSATLSGAIGTIIDNSTHSSGGSTPAPSLPDTPTTPTTPITPPPVTPAPTPSTPTAPDTHTNAHPHTMSNQMLANINKLLEIKQEETAYAEPKQEITPSNITPKDVVVIHQCDSLDQTSTCTNIQ